MPTRTATIGARLDHADVEAMVLDAFTGQRERLLGAARTLTAEEWSRPSRCAAWTAHELVIHVLGATEACRTTLTGEHSVFAGGFDPNSGPNRFVDLRAGEPPAATLDDLEAEIDRARHAMEPLRGREPVPTMTAVWGAEVDWRLFVTHIFWDGWMHERDLLVPLGREVGTTAAEARLATAYGLHSAGIMAGLLGTALTATLELGGTGAATYTLAVDGSDVRVTIADPPVERAVAGDAVIVSDAIAGRPPPLASVLDAPADVVATLAQLGAFLNG